MWPYIPLHYPIPTILLGKEKGLWQQVLRTKHKSHKQLFQLGYPILAWFETMLLIILRTQKEEQWF